MKIVLVRTVTWNHATESDMLLLTSCTLPKTDVLNFAN